MGRRTSFGSIVNQSLKAMAREAARAEKAAMREHKARCRQSETTSNCINNPHLLDIVEFLE